MAIKFRRKRKPIKIVEYAIKRIKKDYPDFVPLFDSSFLG